MKALLTFFGSFRLSGITLSQIEAFAEKRGQGKCGTPVGKSTIDREIQTLRRMFNLAIGNGWVGENPAKRFTYYPEPPKMHRWVRPEEIELLLASCKGKRRHLKAIILLAVSTGLRKEELLGLRWEHVDLKGGRITVKHAKHYRNRYIPIGPACRELLANEVPCRGEYVFTNKSGTRLTRVDRSLASAVKDAGIEKCILHDFRATWATEQLASGTNIETVRKLGGWRDYTTI